MHLVVHAALIGGGGGRLRGNWGWENAARQHAEHENE